MKRLLTGALALLFSLVASATTLNPIQLLNPAGSISGQAIVSTGASSAPAWGGVGVNGIAAIGANTVLANATGSSASPTALAVPSCSAGGNALNWTSGTGFTCASTIPGRLLNVQRFTSGGTYTPTAGTGSVVVEIQGGGGAGGGSPATGAAQCATGAGGAAGGYIKHRMTSGFSGATVTVGAAGTAGSGVAGGAGGSSSFAGITAGGGTGGPVTAAAAAANSIGTAGGTATGGSILNVPGQPGNSSTFQASNNLGFPGSGAASVLGSGGIGVVNGTGGSANGFGSGGGGTLSSSSTAAETGGAGAPGIVIIWEYQ